MGHEHYLALQAQAIFFVPAVLATYDAFKWMGVMAVGIAAFQIFLYWPMWGGVIFPARKGATEEEYYYAGEGYLVETACLSRTIQILKHIVWYGEMLVNESQRCDLSGILI